MSASRPLTGTDLVDCARANAKQGIEVAAKLCGYGEDLKGFQQALLHACEEMGIHIQELSDLIATPTRQPQRGVNIAPDSASEL